MTRKNTLIYFTILFASVSQLRCKGTQNLTSQYKAVYIDQFKLTYFRKILIKSYNNSKAIQEIISTDNSGFKEPILTEDDYKLIDSLTTADNNKMRIDSTQGYLRAEGAQGKRPLGYILEKLDSKWLDSLARQRWKLSELPESWTK